MISHVRVFNSPKQPCDMLQMPTRSHGATSPVNVSRSVLSGRKSRLNKPEDQESNNNQKSTRHDHFFTEFKNILDQKTSVEESQSLHLSTNGGSITHHDSVGSQSNSHEHLARQNSEVELAEDDIPVSNICERSRSKIEASNLDRFSSPRHDAEVYKNRPYRKDKAIKKSAKRRRFSLSPTAEVPRSNSKKRNQNGASSKSLRRSKPTKEKRFEAENPLPSSCNSQLAESLNNKHRLALFQSDSNESLSAEEATPENFQADLKSCARMLEKSLVESREGKIMESNASPATNSSSFHLGERVKGDSLEQLHNPKLLMKHHPLANKDSCTRGTQKRKYAMLNDSLTNHFADSKNKEAESNVNKHNVQLDFLRKRLKKKSSLVPRMSGAHFDDLVRTGRLQQHVMSRTPPPQRATQHSKGSAMKKPRCKSDSSLFLNSPAQVEGIESANCLDEEVCTIEKQRNSLPDIPCPSKDFEKKDVGKIGRERLRNRLPERKTNAPIYSSSFVRTTRVFSDQDEEKQVNANQNGVKQETTNFEKDKHKLLRHMSGSQELATECPKFCDNHESYYGIEPSRESAYFVNSKESDMNPGAINTHFEPGSANNEHKKKNGMKMHLQQQRKSSVKVKPQKTQKTMNRNVSCEKMIYEAEPTGHGKPDELTGFTVPARASGENAHSGCSRDDMIREKIDTSRPSHRLQSGRKLSNIRRHDNLSWLPEKDRKLAVVTKLCAVGMGDLNEVEQLSLLQNDASVNIEGDKFCSALPNHDPFSCEASAKGGSSVWSEDENREVGPRAEMNCTAEQKPIIDSKREIGIMTNDSYETGVVDLLKPQPSERKYDSPNLERMGARGDRIVMPNVSCSMKPARINGVAKSSYTGDAHNQKSNCFSYQPSTTKNNVSVKVESECDTLNERENGESGENSKKSKLTEKYCIQPSKYSQYGGAIPVAVKPHNKPIEGIADKNNVSGLFQDTRNQKEAKSRMKCLWSALAFAERSEDGDQGVKRSIDLDSDSDDDMYNMASSEKKVEARTTQKSEDQRDNINQVTTSQQTRLRRSFAPSGAVVDLTVCDKVSNLEVTDTELEKAVQGVRGLGISNTSANVKSLTVGKFLDPLSREEEIVVEKILRAADDEQIITMDETGITLLGSDLKRLRGKRWLNDELINAYIYLINKRNEEIFNRGAVPVGIPNTTVFNTFFYTRLTSGPSGYDYAGVRRWTSRAGIDISKCDLILVPVNVGNHHWILGGIDLKRKSFFYLDSMKGKDKACVMDTLRQWLKDELCDKHGEAAATRRQIDKWDMILNKYYILRCGVLPLESETANAKVGRWANIPAQEDGGSCGVFMAKIADCLALGLKVYFMQPDIPLIRKRMALDLVRKCLPM